jgi:DNA modification methylase
MKPYYDDGSGITLYHGDCREILPTLPKVDLVLTDPPYGTTSCSWDVVIPFPEMWRGVDSVLVSRRTPVVLFASQPFTSALVMSRPEWFRYGWVWNKQIGGNPLLAKHQPLKVHEDVLVFSPEPHRYIPQMVTGKARYKGGGHSNLLNMEMSKSWSDQYYPTSILDFSNAVRGVHPTQKPVELIEHLTLTYSEAGEAVLDFSVGSGTTLVAAKRLGRRAVGIEIEERYCEIAAARLEAERLTLFEAVPQHEQLGLM